MSRLLVLLSLFLVAACSGSGQPTFQGYVEGEFVDVGPEVSGRIVELAVARGDNVEVGDLLFRIDATEAERAVDQAEAEKARAEAQLANLLGGKRPPEIAVIEAQIAEAKASLETARKRVRAAAVAFRPEGRFGRAARSGARGHLRGRGAGRVRRAAARCRGDAGAHAGDRRGGARRRRGARGARAGANAAPEIHRRRARRRAASRTPITRWVKSRLLARRCSRFCRDGSRR